jgi:hypothetical protein
VIVVDDQNTLFHETPRALLHGGNLVGVAWGRDTDEKLCVRNVSEC